MRGLIGALVGIAVFAIAFTQLESMRWKTSTERKWVSGIAAVVAGALTGFLGTMLGFFR